ncbi:MAG: hypothetical protein AB7L91_05500 [Dehalococcoidia bacterium]
MKSGAIIVVGLVVVIIGGLLAAGVTVTGTETSSGSGPAIAVDGPPAEPPADGSSALVYGTMRTNAGFRLFGLQLIAPDYAASVGFVPPAGCVPDHGAALVAKGPCASIPAAGEVVGGGTLSSGHALVIVQAPISADCYEELREGDRWPSELVACGES